jgi:GNAT superfamily N-acetyltransferase
MVENVVVDAAERGSGLGELLMRHALEEARRAGCYKLALTSNKRRAGAHRFYQRLGFHASHEGFRIDL